jgi:hypothetical protein
MAFVRPDFVVDSQPVEGGISMLSEVGGAAAAKGKPYPLWRYVPSPAYNQQAATAEAADFQRTCRLAVAMCGREYYSADPGTVRAALRTVLFEPPTAANSIQPQQAAVAPSPGRATYDLLADVLASPAAAAATAAGAVSGDAADELLELSPNTAAVCYINQSPGRNSA